MIYFPLPHLFLQSVTSAMMYRVTDGDNDLRTKIGFIWEQYVLKLMQDARDMGVYDEVAGEQPYMHCGSTAYSPDVLVRQGNEMLFLEVKSTVPSVDIRIMQPEAHERNIDMIAGYMVQLYKQIKRLSKYNPFADRVSGSISDHWGIVIVQEDSYIRRILYCDKAREILKLQKESNEWCWFLNHIKVAGLYEVERVSLGGKSIIDACKEVFADNPYSYAFMGYPNKGAVAKVPLKKRLKTEWWSDRIQSDNKKIQQRRRNYENKKVVEPASDLCNGHRLAPGTATGGIFCCDGCDSVSGCGRQREICHRLQTGGCRYHDHVRWLVCGQKGNHSRRHDYCHR